ncbi:MAG: calycin-like domain-containing protein [Rikenellaceae bacterium]|nr:calycin-like domain-containing protein [Rikenellaceae bacterium]
MKKLRFACLALLAALTVVSCSSSKDDPDPQPGPDENYQVTGDDIDGVYLGTMKISSLGMDLGTIAQKVYITKVAGENDLMQLRITDFAFGETVLGNIETSAIQVMKVDEDFPF